MVSIYSSINIVSFVSSSFNKKQLKEIIETAFFEISAFYYYICVIIEIYEYGLIIRRKEEEMFLVLFYFLFLIFLLIIEIEVDFIDFRRIYIYIYLQSFFLF